HERNAERSVSHAPLVQAILSLDEGFGAVPNLPGLHTEAMSAQIGTTKFELMVMLASHAGGLRGAVSYATSLFDPGTIQRLTRHFVHVLQQLSRNPALRMSQIDLV